MHLARENSIIAVCRNGGLSDEMSFILDILIPKKQIKLANLAETLAKWDGEVFSKDPPEFSFDSQLFFYQNRDLEYYYNVLGVRAKRYFALTLQGEALTDLAFTINRQREKLEENTLMRFLLGLLNLDCFYIVLLRDEEEIDRRYQVRNRAELLEAVCQGLNWESPQGIIITKEKERLLE